jgi:preprotein translocase subunit SecD
MMHKISIWKALLVLAISFVAIIFTAPSVFDKKILNVGNPINLGLDLKGGSHLLLDVDFESYIQDQMEMLIDILRKDLRQNKIPYRLLTVEDGVISFVAANLDFMSQIKNTVSKIDKNLEITTNQNKISLSYSKEKMTLLLNDVMHLPFLFPKLQK